MLRRCYRWILTFLGILSFGACTTPSVAPSTTNLPPVALQGTPHVRILSPVSDEVYSLESAVTVQLEVENFVPGNGTVYLIVDERPAVAIPFDTLRYTVTDLQEGSHILRAYLADHNNQSFPHPEAFAYQNYYVGTTTTVWRIEDTEPVVTVHQPKGTYPSGQPVPFDVLLHNFSFVEGYVQIKVWETGKQETMQTIRIDSPTPALLDLPSGAYSYSVELFSQTDVALTSNWTWQNGTFTIR